MRTETVDIAMRDGILLSTTVLTPDASGSWPVIMTRTPYSKSGMSQALGRLCDYGYAVLSQDVRGTGESQGKFDLLRQEANDAVDTAKWLLKQSICDGSLGLIGLSYLAPASVAIASTFKENVKACVWVSPVIGDKGLFLLNGALRLHHNVPWMALRNPQFRTVDWSTTLNHLPLKDALESTGIDEPDWPRMCEDWNGWWSGRDMSSYFRAVDAPGLHFAGFWDFMIDSAMLGYELLKRAQGPQVLVLGPWSHNGVAPEITKTTYRDYGPEASSQFMKRTVNWFDHWLKGKPLPEDLQHTCSAYIPSRGWTSSGEWPPSESHRMCLYLGKGSLGNECGSSVEVRFRYDPTDPVPTEGGAIWEFPKIGLNPGPAGVTTGDRQDVVVFRSEVLLNPVTCLGPGSVTLFVDSDAPCTDFTAKLVDENTDKVGRVVADTIYRWKPDEGPELTLEFEALGHVFEEGHRIRLDISSSNFPKFDRNLNTGISDLVSVDTKIACQTIRVGARSPSRLSLTVL